MADLAASKENPLAGVASPSKAQASSFDGEKQHVMSTIEHMHNHRRLTSRQIQLLAIAGTIGKSFTFLSPEVRYIFRSHTFFPTSRKWDYANTKSCFIFRVLRYLAGAALFVGIGSSLANGGPLSLLLGFMFWCINIWCVAQCQAEMVTLLPIDGSFIRFAGRFVDESWGMAAGYNCKLLNHVHPAAASRVAAVCYLIVMFLMHPTLFFYHLIIHPLNLIIGPNTTIYRCLLPSCVGMLRHHNLHHSRRILEDTQSCYLDHYPHRPVPMPEHLECGA